MTWSAVLNFSDPIPFQAAHQGSDLEVFPTAKGDFLAELTKVRFDRLWMQRFYMSLPLVNTVAHNSDRKVISFLAGPSAQTFLHCGTPVLPGAIVVNCSGEVHQRFGSQYRGGAMSLPTSDLNAAFLAVTGREYRDIHPTYILHPDDPILMSRILSLHEAVGRLAHDTPDILELPEVGRSLEANLSHLLVRCLAQSTTPEGAPTPTRHLAIMARLDDFLEANPNRAIYLTEICGAIGVPERTLRNACEEHLGMGPIRFLTLRRMHLARRALLQANPSETNVTRIVTDHGFWELGRFSVAYRTLFGESPSQTLRRPGEPTATKLNRPSSLSATELSSRLN